MRRSWIYHWGDISKYWCRCCLTFLALFWSSELHFFTKRLHNSQLCSTSNQLTSEKTELKNILPFGCEMQMKFRYTWQNRIVLYCLLNFIFKLYQKYLSLHVVIQYGCSSYASLPYSKTTEISDKRLRKYEVLENFKYGNSSKKQWQKWLILGLLSVPTWLDAISTG